MATNGKRFRDSDEAVAGFEEAIRGYNAAWHVLEDELVGYLQGEIENSAERPLTFRDVLEMLEYLRDSIYEHSPSCPSGETLKESTENLRAHSLRCNMVLWCALARVDLLDLGVSRELNKSRNSLAYVQGAKPEKKSSSRNARLGKVVRARDVAEQLVEDLRAKS